MRYALFKEVVKRQKRKKRKLNTGEAIGDSDAEGSDEDGEGEEEEETTRMSVPPAASQKTKVKGKKYETRASKLLDQDEDVQMDIDEPPATDTRLTADGRTTNERYVFFLGEIVRP
jgi:DNA replication licensing factor MCM3